MMGKGDISPWMPEPDLGTRQALTKVIEEASELIKIASRILAQGYDGVDPASEETNWHALIKEMSDVGATIAFANAYLDIEPDEARIRRKVEGYVRWFEMIGAGNARPSV